MSLTVKFIPRKGQGVCTKIHLLRRASTKKQSKYLQIKDWLNTPWQVHIHGTRCIHEEGGTAKDVCDLPQRVGGEASGMRLSTQRPRGPPGLKGFTPRVSSGYAGCKNNG